MRVGDFEFSVREFAGALGDFGPLNPFFIGYIVVCGADPCGMLRGLWLAGLSQIPLFLSNAIIATSHLIKDYFPDKEVKPEQLALNMGIFDTLTPLFGGLPSCHGAGGLAA